MGKGRRIDAPGARFVALRLRVELRPLRLQLLHLGSNLGGSTLEFLLRLPGGPQVAAQLLDIGLAIEWEHGKAGVFVLPGTFRIDRLLHGLHPVEPVTRLLQPRCEHRGFQGLDDAQFCLGQRPNGFAFLRQFVD